MNKAFRYCLSLLILSLATFFSTELSYSIFFTRYYIPGVHFIIIFFALLTAFFHYFTIIRTYQSPIISARIYFIAMTVKIFLLGIALLIGIFIYRNHCLKCFLVVFLIFYLLFLFFEVVAQLRKKDIRP